MQILFILIRTLYKKFPVYKTTFTKFKMNWNILVLNWYDNIYDNNMTNCIKREKKDVISFKVYKKK